MAAVVTKSKKKIQSKNYRELLCVEQYILENLKLISKFFSAPFLAKFATRLVGSIIKVSGTPKLLSSS